MPEKGWYSLTVRRETAVRVRKLARDMDLTVDELINELYFMGAAFISYFYPAWMAWLQLLQC